MIIELKDCPQKFIEKVESDLKIDRYCKLIDVQKHEARIHTDIHTDKSLVTFDYIATIHCVTSFIIHKLSIYPSGLETENKSIVSFSDIKHLVNSCNDLKLYLSF